ncbi:MAG TPA: hypothetical protein VMW87_02430 [Spirochaetia bacterium]|nr:hypothetical protein [Spirochaetia bacterium]
MKGIEDITNLRQRLTTSAAILTAVDNVRECPAAVKRDTEIVSVVEAQVLDFELRDLERAQRQHEIELRRER